MYRVSEVFVDQIEISKTDKNKFFYKVFSKDVYLVMHNKHIYLIKPHFAPLTYSTHFLKIKKALTTFTCGISFNTLI